jgi:hypothetical protein
MNPYTMLDKSSEYPQFSKAEWAWLEGLTERLGVHATPIWVFHDYGSAGRGRSDAGITKIRGERTRVVSEIDDETPIEFVMCFGPVASACVSNRGDLVEAESLRRPFSWLGPPPAPVCWVTFSLENARRSPSLREWIEMDLEAAVRGYTESQHGVYEILKPGSEEWSVPPYPLFVKILSEDLNL